MITSYILITSRVLSPDVISKIIKLAPTKERLIGSTGVYNKNPINYNSFEYSIVTNEDMLIDELQKKVTVLFHEKEDFFQELVFHDTEIYISLKLVIQIENSQTPDLYFDNNFVKLLGSMNASLDCDMYIMS